MPFYIQYLLYLTVMANTYSIGAFAKRIGRSPSTVRRSEQEGKVTPKRLPSGHRYFDESDVRAMLAGAPVHLSVFKSQLFIDK